MKYTVKKFGAALLAAAMCLSFAACSQGEDGSGTDKNLPKIGILQYAVHSSLDNCYEGLLQGLEAAGYKDGETCTIEFKNAQGDVASANQLAGNMAAGCDMLIGIATPAATATYSAADGRIPTIFCAVNDPVSIKLVNSLDKSGNNCTGSSDRLNLDGQLKMIRAFQPDAKKIGVLYNTAEANSLSNLKTLEGLAGQYGFEIVSKGVQNAGDIPIAAASLVNEVDCINNFTDNLVVDNLSVVIERANAAKIPVYGSEIEQVVKGCLASESLDYVALGKATGELAGRVLGGEKAEDTAVLLIEDSFPVYNSEVAAQLGLSIPEAYQSAQDTAAK